MEKTEIKNKNGEILKTKEGETLFKYRVQPGDEVIPLYNKIVVRENEFTNSKGVKQVAVNHSIKAKVKDVNDSTIHEVYIDLTPSQANSIQKKIDNGVEITQEIFQAYTYETDKYGSAVGIGIKKEFKTPIKFPEEQPIIEEKVE